ncbi:hypothetical protein ACFQS1_30050 [Paractinoplanes rhizophilus]|uniref:Uncharacterized protein n=1 Tax=Paractinoplanes rhizophilus TaxID=1416877 RepID=A0ABW2HYI2_9ACTN
MSDWDTYALYNNAVAEVFFNEDNAGMPAYLDLDEDVVARLAEHIGVPADAVCGNLAAVVRSALNLRSPHIGAFTMIMAEVHRWLARWRQTQRGDRIELDPPPMLAMLAVFSMAAERMGADANMAPNNYFGRLAQVLDLDDAQKRRVETQYRQNVEFLWNVLSIWLTGLDGMRGLPSAVALSHRFVGLSISQALVREHDRSKLPRFFTTYGFHPGQEITPYELEPLLDEWMRRDPPPISKNLVNLWKRQSSARERISSVVALELEAWDGSGLDVSQLPHSHGHRGEVRLIALPRSGLFGSGVELNLVARIPGPEQPRLMTIATAVGDEKPTLALVPGVNGWYRLNRPADFANASVLDGVLRLEGEDGTAVQRRPRRVLPMRKDDGLGVFLEAERLQLADDGLVFSAEELADEVLSVLQQVARPGFRVLDASTAGVPQGWVLFMDVQVLGLLPSEVRSKTKSDLNVLLPSVASQLTFAEGLRLPGRLRKYSAAAPPEIRAVATQAEHLELTVLRKDADDPAAHDDSSALRLDQVVCRQGADGAAVILNLGHHHLPVGDYEVLLTVDRAKDPAQRLPFVLRSGDAVDLAMWARSPRLVHQPARHGGRTAVSADQWQEASPPFVDGATAYGEAAELGAASVPRKVWWTADRPVAYAPSAALTLTSPDPGSCMVTGAHFWDLPFATSAMVQGICRTCGLVKRFPNTHWMAKARKSARDKAEADYRVEVSRIEPVDTEQLTWDIGLDALMHTGGGGCSALERIALQIEGSLLFVDGFERTLEALGHIEIKRDERTMVPAEWEIAPSALAELADGSYLLAGYWPSAMVADLERAVAACGGKLTVDVQSGAPTRRVVTGLAAETAVEVAEELGEVAVAADAARAILRAVPDLSAVERSLPQLSMPGSQRIKRFDVGSAAWVPQHHASVPGAYQLESFGSTYVVRRSADIAEGTVRVGTAQLVKHLEAFQAGRPLIAYDERHRSLDVPLGADLPGLYGRAAVLCSGRPPAKLLKQRILRYIDVPADVADMLASRLTH